MRRNLSEEIKKLKLRAEEAKKMVKARINEIDNEMLHVASAIANLQMLYFSGEISDKSYTSGMNHLRKLKESLAKEKQEAKHILDKLEKTFEAASGLTEKAKEEKPAPQPKKPLEAKPSAPPSAPKASDGEEIIVKIAD